MFIKVNYYALIIEAHWVISKIKSQREHRNSLASFNSFKTLGLEKYKSDPGHHSMKPAQ